MLQPLTHKEKSVLEFIESYMLQEGLAPSYLEIKDHFGFASYNSVQRYLKQLQTKGYVHVPGGNRKRAIQILHSAQAVQNSLEEIHKSLNSAAKSNAMSALKETSTGLPTSRESLSLPLLGRVAAGVPLEAIEHDEFVDIPPSMVRRENSSYALKVQGQSMIDDGIFDGDVILIQEQSSATNGEIVVAMVEDEATVKRFYFHSATNQIELRPANTTMDSLWYLPDQVELKGVVVGLIRKY